MTAPRIDAVRNEIRYVRSLLGVVGDQVEDLHILAYNRHRAGQADKVNGGSRDYALDNHGDPKARALYTQLADDLRHTINHLTGSIKAVKGYLTAGGGTTRRDSSGDASVDEVIAALDAQRQRRARGEYEPAPLVEQPPVMSQTEWRVECEALRSAVRKVTDAFAQEHQTCQSATVDSRGQHYKLMRRYPMNALTPREREAWRRANQSVSEQNGEKAS